MTNPAFPGRDPSAWPIPDLTTRLTAADRYHVAVVGAGIGGLSAAAVLAQRGLKVLVIEAHDRPGGYCTSWGRLIRGVDGSRRRFVFDAGVQDISGLGPKGAIRRLLSQLGVEGRIAWRRVLHRYLQDGSCLDFPENPAQLIEILCERFPDEAHGIRGFLTEIGAVHRDLYAGLDETKRLPPPRTTDAIDAWRARFPHAGRWMDRPYGDMLASFFSNSALKHLLTSIADYLTDQPECLNVGEMAPLFSYYFEGGFYPVGGSQRLANVLRSSITDNGGSVLLRTRVMRILVEDGRAAGVVTPRATYYAPVVIANADAVTTLMNLMDPYPLPKRYIQRVGALRRGPSAILVNLALDFVPDVPARVFFRDAELRFGVGNPSSIDSTLAPSGCAALTLLCLVSELEAAPWFELDKHSYRLAKEAFADRLIAATETIVPDLTRHILYRETAAPPTFTRYTGALKGNIYGAARGQWCPHVKSPVPGLMLVGAGCQNGPGIEAAAISGMMVADLIAPLP